jgi:hypothetical protein
MASGYLFNQQIPRLLLFSTDKDQQLESLISAAHDIAWSVEYVKAFKSNPDQNPRKLKDDLENTFQENSCLDSNWSYLEFLVEGFELFSSNK